MNKSDIVKSWRIAGDFYLAKDDKVRIKTAMGLIEGILRDVSDKGPVISVGKNSQITIAIDDIDWITGIDRISYEPGDCTLVAAEEDKE